MYLFNENIKSLTKINQIINILFPFTFLLHEKSDVKKFPKLSTVPAISF